MQPGKAAQPREWAAATWVWQGVTETRLAKAWAALSAALGLDVCFPQNSIILKYATVILTLLAEAITAKQATIESAIMM